MTLDYNITLMCAMRYALGRKTYVVQSVTTLLIGNKDSFTKSDKVVMVREINEAIENKRSGMAMDTRRWVAVVDAFLSSDEDSTGQHNSDDSSSEVKN